MTDKEKKFEIFRVGDVFKFVTSNKKQKLSESEPGPVRLISTKGTNNGVVAYVKALGEPERARVITVSDIDGVAHWQPFKFMNFEHVQKLVSDQLDENSALYVCTILNRRSSIYSYSNMRSKNRLSAEAILLPVIESDDASHVYTADDIDWQYMNDYIQKIKEKYENLIIENNRKQLDEYRRQAQCVQYEQDSDKPAAFAVFSVSDVFDVSGTAGGAYTRKDNLIPGDYRYVTGTSQNNGNTSITCGNSDRADRGNCITVSETGGGPFYQPFDFVGYGPITVLRREGLNEQQYLYVCACMSRQNIRYGFNQGRTGKQIRAEKISLPVKEIKDSYTPDDIDWDYMGRHVVAVELHAVQKVEEMQKKTETILKKLVHNLNR